MSSEEKKEGKKEGFKMVRKERKKGPRKGFAWIGQSPLITRPMFLRDTVIGLKGPRELLGGGGSRGDLKRVAGGKS